MYLGVPIYTDKKLMFGSHIMISTGCNCKIAFSRFYLTKITTQYSKWNLYKSRLQPGTTAVAFFRTTVEPLYGIVYLGQYFYGSKTNVKEFSSISYMLST